MSDKHDSGGMAFLETKLHRWVTVYIPMALFMFVLLFPFYWMTITAFKPDAELLSRDGNPFWVVNPTLAHFKKLLFDTDYPIWLFNTMLVSVVATAVSLVAAVLAAYSIERLRFKGARVSGLAIFLAYLIPPSILFIPLAIVLQHLGLFNTRWALIFTYPTFLIPFCTWLLMGYFQIDSLRAGGVRADRRRLALGDPRQDHPAAGRARADLRRNLRLHACRGTSSSTRSPSSPTPRSRRCRSPLLPNWWRATSTTGVH